MTLNKFLVSIAFGCVAVQSAYPQTPEWPSQLFKINILSDSYEDVVKRLGTPTDGTAEPERSERFKVAGGEVLVAFTNGTCESPKGGNDKRGWDVPESTVEAMVVEWGFKPEGTQYPTTSFTLHQRKIDTTGFRIEETESDGTWWHDDRTGISYNVVNGFIAAITYFPSQEQEQKLRCETTR